MSLIPTPAAISDAPTAAQAGLQAVEKKLGAVPNMFRLIATSPAALEGYLGMSGALAKGTIGPALYTRTRSSRERYFLLPLAKAASTSSSLIRAAGFPRWPRFCSSVPSPIMPGCGSAAGFLVSVFLGSCLLVMFGISRR